MNTTRGAKVVLRRSCAYKQTQQSTHSTLLARSEPAHRREAALSGPLVGPTFTEWAPPLRGETFKKAGFWARVSTSFKLEAGLANTECHTELAAKIRV
jgi:hypothetical protein